MNKLSFTAILLSTLAFLGCATGDRIEIYETGIIYLNKKEVSFEDLMTVVLETDQLEGDTPVIYISSKGEKRKSTVDQEVVKYIQAVNDYYFPKSETNKSTDDPFSEKHEGQESRDNNND